MSLAILAAPWRMHSSELQQQLVASERILFFDGSVARRHGDRWSIICYACDKGGEAEDFCKSTMKRFAT